MTKLLFAYPLLIMLGRSALAALLLQSDHDGRAAALASTPKRLVARAPVKPSGAAELTSDSRFSFLSTDGEAPTQVSRSDMRGEKQEYSPFGDSAHPLTSLHKHVSKVGTPQLDTFEGSSLDDPVYKVSTHLRGKAVSRPMQSTNNVGSESTSELRDIRRSFGKRPEQATPNPRGKLLVDLDHGFVFPSVQRSYQAAYPGVKLRIVGEVVAEHLVSRDL